MTIICLEGASAVGKTSTSNELTRMRNTYIVPEVNLLFERPTFATNTWYLERQVERWKIAREKQKDYELVILDGDIFQPLSYNWCFDFKIYEQSLDAIYEFYQAEIRKGKIMFPDRYFYLYTSINNLKKRKENDKTRKRRNFETHIDIIEPHQRYYEALNQLELQFVQLIEAENIECNARVIEDNLPSSKAYRDSERLIDSIKNWLMKTKP
ncbi:AAA family ATPase [Gracilibacillus sp. S3-1-1]|uniref:AAA family ATPase n=1 Tax=Gracilibacillus pellucidus TaxID=3095368 RepID=A0ACC6M5N5_9BACI|nr:AAA family ATPase [Gracilibacillus sp. S3-1-1]MDX8046259.1 AAA family ATPase [Gracilibacillus sp. S3-1-1]